MAGRPAGVGWVLGDYTGEVRGTVGAAPSEDQVISTPFAAAVTGIELLLALFGLALAVGAVVYLLVGGSADDTDGGTVAEPTSPTSGTTTEDQPTDTDAGTAGTRHDADERRVLELLEAHDGRMKQGHIVDQTDWSKSKVSMVLSEMEAAGTVSKLRVGRENIVSLAGSEPEGVGSPFEEE